MSDRARQLAERAVDRLFEERVVRPDDGVPLSEVADTLEPLFVEALDAEVAERVGVLQAALEHYADEETWSMLRDSPLRQGSDLDEDGVERQDWYDPAWSYSPEQRGLLDHYPDHGWEIARAALATAGAPGSQEDG